MAKKTNAPENPRATPGHNLAPEGPGPAATDITAVLELLQKLYGAHAKEATDLLAEARELPKSVEDDGVMAKLASVTRRMVAVAKRGETDRQREKEPYLRGGEAVDGFFNGIKERLETAIKILTVRIATYREEQAEVARAAALKLAQEEAKKVDEATAKLGRAKNPERVAELQVEATLAAVRAGGAMAAVGAKAANVVLDDGTKIGSRIEKVAKVDDYELLPLDKLRPYIKRDALDAAVRKFAEATRYEEKIEGATIQKRDGTKIT